MRTKAIAIGLGVLSLVGCDSMPGCDTSAVGSVTVSVFDSSGAPVAPDSVVYTVDGSAEADCESLGGDGSEYMCGWEVDGVFEIIVMTSTGSFTESVTVEMSLDGCHVQGEFVDVVVD
jgi:hypothetical protein